MFFPSLSPFLKPVGEGVTDDYDKEKFKYSLFKVEKCTTLHYCKNSLVQKHFAAGEKAIKS